VPLQEEGGLRVGIHLVLNLRQQYAGKAQDHVGEAAEGEPGPREIPLCAGRPFHRSEGKEEVGLLRSE
jgi:hypothetical protein